MSVPTPDPERSPRWVARLEELRSEQRQLRSECDRLTRRLATLETRLASVAADAALLTPAAVAEASPEAPGLFRPGTAAAGTGPGADPAPGSRVPPAPPRAADPAPAPPPLPRPAPAPAPLPPAAVPRPAATPRRAGESIEVRIGSTWLVRVGAVALLTSLVLLTVYFYEHVVPRLGPFGKVGLLYLAAGLLTGVGAWLERSAARGRNAGLGSYARVLFGAGLAAVYFVTYAAGNAPGLRVIPSPFLAGLLLLGWAGGVVWLADRRDSQTLATFALLLAYFTSAVNRVVGFSLFSNLVLTAAAIFLLRRHRWTVFTFASLLATYGSYAFWRYGPEGQAAGPPDFGTENLFLALYWLLFTAGTFLVDEETLRPGRKAGFAALNHGALFGLVGGHLRARYPDHFWTWAVGFGLLLIALGSASTAWRRARAGRPASAAPRDPAGWWLRLDPPTEATHRLLGIVFFTVGLVTRFGDWDLALLLAAESAVLLLAAEPGGTPPWSRWERAILLGLAELAALPAMARAAVQLLADADAGGPLPVWPHVWLGLGISGLLLGQAWWSARRVRADDPAAGSGAAAGPGAGGAGLDHRAWRRAAGPYFALLSTWLGFYLVENEVPAAEWRPLVLAAAGLAWSLGSGPLRLPSVALYAFFYALCAQAQWLAPRLDLDAWLVPRAAAAAAVAGLRWWNPLVIVGASFGLSHWWERRDPPPPFSAPTRLTAALTLAFGATLILSVWLRPRVGGEAWLLVGGAFALGLLAYGLAVRAWAVALASQWLLASAACLFASVVLSDVPLGAGGARRSWLALGVPLAFVGALALWRTWGRRAWRGAHADRPPPAWVEGLGTGYELGALVTLVGWVGRFAAPGLRFAVLAALGLGLRWLAGRHPAAVRRWSWYGSGLLAVGGAFYWWGELTGADSRLSWFHWIGFLAAGGQVFLPRRWLEGAGAAPPRWVFAASAVGAVLGGWRWWSNFYGAALAPLAAGAAGPPRAWQLAVVWSLYAAAVFVVGLLGREKLYRWGGLLILAVTLARIVVVDFWQADLLHRIVDLFALSAVLLALGFIYNRFQDKLRDWL